MPELPEVETIRRDLMKKILRRPIAAISVTREKIIRMAPAEFARLLQGVSFTNIDRVGKLLIIHLSTKKHFLLVHLKMTGQLIYRVGATVIAGGHSLTKKENFDLPHKHTHVTFTFKDGSQLFFNDLRLFGYMQLTKPDEVAKIRGSYGIEPLTPSFTLENFKKALAGRKTSIKAVLLNQNVIAGLGNIYADEVCFLARVRPDRKTHVLTPAEIKKLYQACEKVIAKGIAYRGTTFNNFVDGEGNRGGFLPFLNVYGRAGLSCRRCKNVIQKIKTAGRGTHLCSQCQI